MTISIWEAMLFGTCAVIGSLLASLLGGWVLFQTLRGVFALGDLAWQMCSTFRHGREN